MLGRKVALGAATMGGLQFLAKVLDLLAMVVLARILTPEDFGLVAIAVSVLLIANSVTELPVLDVLVQRDEIGEEDVQTAFTLTMLRGFLVSVLIVASSWPIASFYEDARLIFILWAISLAPLFQGLASPAMVHYLRKIEFGPPARTNLIGKVVSVAISLIISFATGSYWALVAGPIITQAIITLCTYVYAPWRPAIRLTGAPSILKFAGWVTLSRVIWTVSIQADRLLVGRLLGKESLGFYSMASEISSLATYAVAGPIMKPIFSGFSRMRDDVGRLQNAYLKSQQALMMVVMPFGIGLAAAANNLVPLLLGEGWGTVVPVIRWLAPVIALQMMSVPVQALALALGMPKTLAYREAVGILIRLPATVIAAIYVGLIGAAAARSLTGIVIIGINLAIARNLIDLPIMKQFLNGWRSIVSAFLMAFLILCIDFGLAAQNWSYGPILAIQIPVGLAVYLTSHLGLWHLSGKSDGAETFLLKMIKNRASR